MRAVALGERLLEGCVVLEGVREPVRVRASRASRHDKARKCCRQPKMSHRPQPRVSGQGVTVTDLTVREAGGPGGAVVTRRSPWTRSARIRRRWPFSWCHWKFTRRSGRWLRSRERPRASCPRHVGRRRRAGRRVSGAAAGWCRDGTDHRAPSTTPIAEEDLDAYAAIVADPEVMRHLGGPSDRATAWRQIAIFMGHRQMRGWTSAPVVERATGRLVGRAGLWQAEGWPGPEVGWLLDRSVGVALLPRRSAGPSATWHLAAWAWRISSR